MHVPYTVWIIESERHKHPIKIS